MWYKLKRIMMRPNGVEKQVRPKWWWQPWANTIAYYKFNGDSLDYSGNNYDITSVTSYNTLSSWIKVAYFNGDGGTADTWNCNTNLWYNLFKVDQDITISLYVKVSSFGSSAACPYRAQGNGSYRVSLLDLYSNQVQWGLWKWWWNFSIFNTSISTSDFQHIVLVYDHTNKTASMYKNWELVSTVSTTWYSLFTNCNWVSVWFSPFNSSASEYLSEMIFENKKRNAQEILNYYNQTKSNYWL